MSAYTSALIGAPTTGFFTKGDTYTDGNGTTFVCTATGYAAPVGSVGSSYAQFQATAAGESAHMFDSIFSFGSAGVEDGLTAHAGGTQAAALALSATKSVHRVSTVGTAADSVKLPAATGSGDVHVVINDAAANSMQLFGSGTDTIDAVATATGVAVAAAKRRICVDYAAGKWISILGA